MKEYWSKRLGELKQVLSEAKNSGDLNKSMLLERDIKDIELVLLK